MFLRVAVSAVLLFVSTTGQVCRAGKSPEKCGGSADVAIPLGEAALWAMSKIPVDCDSQTDHCNWDGTADAWRYVLNAVSAVMSHTKDSDTSWLPVDSLKQIQDYVRQMGQDPGMWYGNWINAAGQTRQLIEQLRSWLRDQRPSYVLPSSNIGTHFPTLGRSVAVSTDGDMGATVTLANGFALPVLGFGVWQIPADGTCYKSVSWALELGYRHIDTAQGYRNEEEVGRAMKDSGIPRSEICLVTKLSDGNEYRTARQRFEQQLTTLGVEYIDVYMLHSPGRSKEDRQAAWAQMEQLYDEGKIKALGVSNFNIELLLELFSFARIRPTYIQNKYSIYQPGSSDETLKNQSLMEWLAQEKIVMTGYSTIHPGHGGYLSPLEDPIVLSIAKRHDRTAAQVLHRWLLQLGAAVIPRSTKYERIKENGDIFRFALTEADMRLLNGISTLVKSNGGSSAMTRAPTWVEDVFELGLQ